MKKLKIFLLLSILLCLGFVLSSEVHAEEITNLTGTKWLLPEDLNSTSYIADSFDIDLLPYEIELNTLLKLNYPFYVEEMNSITTWEELLDIVPYLITDIGGTNVVNNLVVENDKNNYLIVPTRGYLQIYNDGQTMPRLYYGLDLASADNLPVVSGTLTYDHPIDGTVTVNFLELYHFFFATSSSTSFWSEMPIPPGGTMLDPLLSTITITGGDDVTNPTLIAWLEENATQIIEEPSGPKRFEVGDVLPATTQLRITSINDAFLQVPSHLALIGTIKTDNDNFTLCKIEKDMDYPSNGNAYFLIDGIDYFFTWDSEPFAIVDTSSWSESKRTISSVTSYLNEDTSYLLWEDLGPASSNAKPFEVGDELPAGYIKISWDFTDKFNDIFDEDVTFWIVGDGDQENNLYIEIEVWDYGEEVRFTINQEEFYIDTPGETVISIPIPYTITQVDANNGYDYYVSIGDALMWEVVTEEDFIYDQAYQEGYSDGYYLGYEHARERYGYYDSRTDEWLTVSEYINRYGTDKPGQSDFYNNFDKYFIPAMIIVFGGAIVLTILKVFKGRE